MTTISSSTSGISSYGGGFGGGIHRAGGHGGKPDFSKIDTDGSGGLDKTELKAMLDKGPQGAQGSQGANSVSSDDMFTKLDTDGDGSVTESELKAGMKPPSASDQAQQSGWAGMGMDTQAFASMMGSGGMGAMQGPPPPPPPSDNGGSSISDAINSLDSDSDGKVSASEFGLSSTDSTSSKQKALFDAIDSDQDGSLSKTEVSGFEDKIKALLEKMQQMGAQQSASSTTSSSSISVTA